MHDVIAITEGTYLVAVLTAAGDEVDGRPIITSRVVAPSTMPAPSRM